jgi:hypothetical protein
MIALKVKGLDMSESDFWLYRWIDACGVSSYQAAKKHLADPVSREALVDFASAAPYTTEPLADTPVPSIAAGCGVDLSGNLDCIAWECLKSRVDDLLRHICLYFDRVVVVGASAYDLVRQNAGLAQEHFNERILSHIQLLLYLREIGAEPLLAFREKPPACEIHLKESADKAGLRELLEISEEESVYLEGDATISLRPHEDHVDYRFDHPKFEHTVWGVIPQTSGDASDMVARRTVCAFVFQRYVAHLASDVRAARSLRTPLGSTIRYHRRLLQGQPHRDGIPEIAFALGLPVLRGIDPATVIRLRSDEHAAFERFRRALRTAVSERFRSAADPRAEVLAGEIQADLIVPALYDIEGRLESARSALAKKASVNLSLGAIATACGLFANEPILTAAGLGGAVGALTALHKHVDEVREVELSDMYFLWHVADQHGRRDPM